MDEELNRLRSSCLTLLPDSRLITATSTHVRVQISKTRFRTLTVVLHFPDSGYPDSQPLLVQLTSKTLSEGFVLRLTQICDQEVRKYSGQSQIIPILRFIDKFLDDHPLCCCAGEISRLKGYGHGQDGVLRPEDKLKLQQSTSSIVVTLVEALYKYKVRLEVPNEYPDQRIDLQTSSTSSNFPPAVLRFLAGQSKEIARRCVEPPLNTKRGQRSVPFEKRPSLEPVVRFLAQMVHSLPSQECAVCKARTFPENPDDVVQDEADERHVERVYCGHLFHLGCLLNYMKSPPFTGDQKPCPIPSCNKPIYHDKYKVSAVLTEARWAYQEARKQELEDVEDFLQ